MKKGVFAICDSETDYLYRLMDYLEPRVSQRFQMHAFSNEQSLWDYASQNTLEILLISNQVARERIGDLKCKNIFLLTEGVIKAMFQNYLTINKYQSAQEIFRQVMFIYAQKEKERNYKCAKQLYENINLIGFYTPWNEDLQTSLAFAYGSLSGKDKSTLYLNFKGYHGFSQYMKRTFQRDLIDLIYYLKNKEEQFVDYLDSIVCKTKNVDYVPPVENPMDIRAVTKEDWLKLLTKLSSDTSYRTIVLDITDEIDESLALLEECSKIYIPTKEDVSKDSKMGQLNKTLIAKGKQNILEKIESVRISKDTIENVAMSIHSDKKGVE